MTAIPKNVEFALPYTPGSCVKLIMGPVRGKDVAEFLTDLPLHNVELSFTVNPDEYRTEVHMSGRGKVEVFWRTSTVCTFESVTYKNIYHLNDGVYEFRWITDCGKREKDVRVTMTVTIDHDNQTLSILYKTEPYK